MTGKERELGQMSGLFPFVVDAVPREDATGSVTVTDAGKNRAKYVVLVRCGCICRSGEV